MLTDNPSHFQFSFPNPVTLDAAGRILLPKSVRDDLHLSVGDKLMLQVHDGCVVLKSPSQALANAQAFFARLAPSEVVLSDELIADRRREAADE